MTQTVTGRSAAQILTIALAAALLLAGCGGKPDAAACEQAMRKQLSAGMEAAGNGTTIAPGTKPKECEGLSDQELEALGKKVLGEQLGGTTAP